MKQIKRNIPVSLSLVLILMLVACVSPTEEKTRPKQETMTEQPKMEEPEEVSPRLEAGEGLEHLALEVTLDDVIEIFFSHYPTENIHLHTIQLMEENNRYLYLLTGGDDTASYHLKVDATTSEIFEKETVTEKEEKEALDVEAVISPFEAMEAALTASGCGYVEKWTLTLRQDQILYLIFIKEGVNQKIDALTGETL